MINLQHIGKVCKRHRETLNLYQYDVAKDVGYSKENISSFERGRNDSAIILLWYLLHGLEVDELGVDSDEGF